MNSLLNFHTCKYVGNHYLNQDIECFQSPAGLLVSQSTLRDNLSHQLVLSAFDLCVDGIVQHAGKPQGDRAQFRETVIRQISL